MVLDQLLWKKRLQWRLHVRNKCKEKVYLDEISDAPEIEVEEAYIVTNVDEEQEIVCIVNSSPAADVSWKINDTPLDSDSPGIVLRHKENRHSLLIISASNHSVGRYSCTARNELGEATGVADISGEAAPAVILSSHMSDKTNEFNLEWSVESESPVDMFEVAVKKQGEAKWDLHEVIVDTDNNNTSINDTSETDSIHRGELLLTNLEPSTSYEVTIASKNSFGMGSRGDIFTFKTTAIGLCNTNKYESSFLGFFQSRKNLKMMQSLKQR